MKFCERHWDMLTESVKTRELNYLDRDDSVNGTGRVTGLTLLTFEPLLYAHNRIVDTTVDYVGFDLFLPDSSGNDRCPLCFITVNHAESCIDPRCTVADYDHWVERAADDALAVWNALMKEETDNAQTL